jgi:hypothetical protein
MNMAENRLYLMCLKKKGSYLNNFKKSNKNFLSVENF